MKKTFFCAALAILLCASACQKCQECKQYCAYCQPAGNNGILLKICANKDVTHSTVDSMMQVYQSVGYTCNMADKYKRVCDSKDKLNDAVNYYLLEDYYCYPQ
jgi:hypothetical protein